MPTRADRLVADTNVLISAALRTNTPPRQTLDVVQSAGGVLLFSDETFTEVHDRLLKPKFDRYVTRENRAAFPHRGVRVGVHQPGQARLPGPG